jgi:hypothetical protein
MRLHTLKYAVLPAALFAIAAIAAPAYADDRSMQKAPTESLGDEGKLPPTNTMGGEIRDMKGPDVPGTPSAAEGDSSGTSGKAANKRMGDEGTLPATGTMGKKVPGMTTQHDSAK